jgi:ribonuclease P protein component
VGPLTVIQLADAPTETPVPPRVAYSIGRKVGGAVVRNKVRRRCRAALVELATAAPGGVPAGAYLVSAAPAAAQASYPELRSCLAEAIQRLGEQRKPRSGRSPSTSAPSPTCAPSQPQAAG